MKKKNNNNNKRKGNNESLDWFGPNPQKLINLVPQDLRSYERIGVGGLGCRGGRVVFGLERVKA